MQTREAPEELFKGIGLSDDTKEQFILKGFGRGRVNFEMQLSRPRDQKHFSQANYQCLSRENERTHQELHFAGLKPKIRPVEPKLEPIDLSHRLGGGGTPDVSGRHPVLAL